jgi:hypothetical protein
MLRSVIDHARDRSVSCLLSEAYDEASVLDDAVDAMLSALDCESPECDRTLPVQLRLDRAIADAAQITDSWASRITAFRADSDLALSAVSQRHSEECEALKAAWARPEALLPFSKPSPALLQLRRRQKSLALARDYGEAKALKQECDRMLQEEAAAAGLRAAEAMRADFAQLCERQRREREGFAEHTRACVVKMEGRRAKELRANENLRRQLQCRIGIGRKPAIVVPKVVGAAHSWHAPSVDVLRRLNSYKKAPETVRVPVKLVPLK